ncbi:MAG: ferrous iron transport protein A, partial [Parolsenella sp.]
MTTLKDIPVGSSCTVKAPTGVGAVKRRIMDMGITKGAKVKVVK